MNEGKRRGLSTAQKAELYGFRHICGELRKLKMVCSQVLARWCQQIPKRGSVGLIIKMLLQGTGGATLP